MHVKSFHVGLTRECFGTDGRLVFDPAALEPLRNTPGLSFEFFEKPAPVLTPELSARCDAIICRGPRVERSSIERADRRVRLVARFGAGVDKTDLSACSELGIIVTNTPDAVRRPVATSILLLILALSHRLFEKERVAREARWADRLTHMGNGLAGRTIGSIGLGNIAQEMFRLLGPLETRHIGYSRNPDRAALARLNVDVVDLDTVFRRSDFVCLNIPLSNETRHLVGAREIGLMKPTAYLINTSRGSVVDERALLRALTEHHIAGAALDVFEVEPIVASNPILKLENVIVTPHSLAVTEECNRDIAASAIRAAIDLSKGVVPAYVVNRDVLDHPDVAPIFAGPGIRRGV